MRTKVVYRGGLPQVKCSFRLKNEAFDNLISFMEKRIIFSAEADLLDRLDARIPPTAKYGRAKVIRDLLEQGLASASDRIPIEAARRIQKLKPALLRMGVSGVTLFGSRIDGVPRPDSDLDIGIDYDAARVGDLFNLVAIKHRIVDALADLDLPLDIAFLPTMTPAIRRSHDQSCLQVIG